MSRLGRAISVFLQEGPSGIARKLRERRYAKRLSEIEWSSWGHVQKFSAIYNEGLWLRGEGESLSGNGSSLRSTSVLRPQLEKLLRELTPDIVLDAPCGDFNWMKAVTLPRGCLYIGGDIVPSLIKGLTEKYGMASSEGEPSRLFLTLDLTADPFPSADIWICRDCLQHLSNSDIIKVLQNFAASAIEFALISNHINVGENNDIATGGCQIHDLMLPPFNLPPPARCLPDEPAGASKRLLCLWRREDIAIALLQPVALVASTARNIGPC